MTKAKHNSIVLSDIKNIKFSWLLLILILHNIIKDFEQFVPMTIHLIDMNTLKPTWDPNL